MMLNYVVCGKLDSQIELTPITPQFPIKMRLKAKGLGTIRQSSLSLSASENNVWFEGREWDVSDFFAMAMDRRIRRLLVLTNKERLYIVEHASICGIKVDVFEVMFPIFPRIKYSSRLSANIDALRKCQRKISQLGISPNGMAKELADQHLRSVVKKLRFKTSLDSRFFFGYQDSYREVFKLKEERPERTIIALDFNSMYVDSMKGDFCDPASTSYRNFGGETFVPSSLHSGIYRARLVGANSGFLLDHHPFLFKRLGISHHFQLKCGDSIEAVLHKNELEYFAAFFQRVEILEGLFSINHIEHPLLERGLNLYAQRKYHRSRGDQVAENFCKISMQHLHSATNQKIFRKKNFANLVQIRRFLSTNFAMCLDDAGPDEVEDFLMHHKYFSMKKTSGGYQLAYLDIEGSSTVFSLSAQVVANARLKIIKTLEGFLSHRSVELCYSNVDSIHLSINRDEIVSFLEKNSVIISNELGALKIEAIADKGYWFDIGRYWLKKDDQVVLFKNKGFNHKGAANEFVCRRKLSCLIETPGFSHLHTYIAKLENSFGYGKRLMIINADEARYVRFQYEEIKDTNTANLTEASEQLSSKNEKVDLFRRISNSHKSSPLIDS